MGMFEWNKTLELGVSEMDLEHKTLIKMMASLEEAGIKNSSKEAIEKLIGELASFTVKHFKDEETHMEKIGFSGLEVHKVIHQDLLDKFTKHVEAFKNGDGKISNDFLSFLKNWITAHIMYVDKKYTTPA